MNGRPAGRARAGRSALRAAAAFAALAAVTARAQDGPLRHLDRAAIEALETRDRPAAAVSAARAVSALAEPAFASAVLAALAATAARRADWRAACLPGLVVAGGAVARRRLSRAIARPRPPAAVWMTEPEGFSLPSKHTTLAVLTAGACADGAGVRGTPRLVIPLLAGAGVGASRVLLGVHWPSDVLAAWLFAEGWLALAESVRGLSGADEQDRYPARSGRRFRDAAEPGVQETAVAVPAEHHEVEPVLGGVVAQSTGRIPAFLGVQADADRHAGGDGGPRRLERLACVTPARVLPARLVRLVFPARRPGQDGERDDPPRPVPHDRRRGPQRRHRTR